MSKNHFQSSEPNQKKQPTYGKIWTIILAVLLILSLIFCTVAIFTASRSHDQSEQQLTSQQTTIDKLTEEVQSAKETMESQQSELSALESQLQEKEDTIASYQNEISDLASRYNKLVETKKQNKKNPVKETVGKDNPPQKESSTTTKPPKYAIDDVTKKTCYLTFDDGPSDNTLKILKILKQYNIKATFFVINTNNIQYVKQIHEQGHTVALHSYSHNYSQIYSSQKAYFNDLEKIGKSVKKYTGQDTKVIRFPGGSSNTVSKNYCSGIMTALTKETANRGYVSFDWNVDSSDASGNNVPVSTIMDSIRDYGGFRKQEVVLMHDSSAKKTTVDALPKIIEFYIDKGYTFAPLTTSTPPVTHAVLN